MADDRIVWRLRLDGGEPVQIRDSAKAVLLGGFFHADRRCAHAAGHG